MLNPVIALLYNAETNRWHPIIFCESPLPGPPSSDKLVRHKSKGHHTSGFDTRDEAIAEAKQIAEKIKPEAIGPVSLSLENQFEWDGKGIPAMVEFF